MEFKIGLKSIRKTIFCISALQSAFLLFSACSNETPNAPIDYTKPPSVKILPANSIYAVNDPSIFSVAAFDSSGTVKTYLWSFDGTTFDTTIISTYQKIFSPTNFGEKKIYAKVIDNDGLVSAVDSMAFIVHQYAPVVSAKNLIGHIRDTLISFKDSLLVIIAAADTNGRIMKYLLKIGAQGWDSADFQNPVKYLTYPAGGYVTAFIGAKDDDGIMGIDSFHVLYNRPPTSCGLKTDYNTDKAGWGDYTYSTAKGSIQASFLGEDPDGGHDSLKYILYWGTDPNSLSFQYSGVNTIVSISDIPIETYLYWKVVAKDLYGDSVAKSGTYSINTVPPIGLFWNLVTSNLIMSFALGQPTSFDGKMWVFIKNKAVSKGYDSYNKPIIDYYYSVYNATDYTNWNLVTNNLIVAFNIPQPTAFDNKMWIFINNNTSPNGYDSAGKPLVNYFHSVYNSTDGITWNLATKTVPMPFAMPQPTIFDNKMWIFINNNTSPNGYDSAGKPLVNYFHSVYNSTDGITWKLVTNAVLLPFVMPQPTFFGGKLWVFVNNKTVLKTTDLDGRQFFDYYHCVYSSTDCINWNLITNTAIMPFSMPQPTSFNDKMWVFINTNGVSKGVDLEGKPLIDYYHSVYKSGN